MTGISPEQIKQGLEALVTRKESWPPNAVEFRQLCLPETISPDGHNSSAYLSFDSPDHPQYEHYSKKKAIKDMNPERMAEKKKKGNEALKNLKEMV